METRMKYINGLKGSLIENIVFTTNGVIKLLKELNPQKTSSPDGVSARILKECAKDIADALVLLFTASLKQGIIVTPLYK